MNLSLVPSTRHRTRSSKEGSRVVVAWETSVVPATGPSILVLVCIGGTGGEGELIWSGDAVGSNHLISVVGAKRTRETRGEVTAAGVNVVNVVNGADELVAVELSPVDGGVLPIVAR